MTDREILQRLLGQVDKVKEAKEGYHNARSSMAKRDALTEWTRAQVELFRIAGIVRNHLNIKA